MGFTAFTQSFGVALALEHNVDMSKWIQHSDEVRDEAAPSLDDRAGEGIIPWNSYDWYVT